MHADITRVVFDPEQQYSSVRHQQGRVLLDADWNEQRDIDLHDRRTVQTDVIGRTGAPTGAPGMEITASGGQLSVGAGRYYVDGIRCENPAITEIAAPDADGRYLAYLEAWERPVSALQDPRLREVALGGPDTTTRTRVEWGVRFLEVPTGTDCNDEPDAWTRLLAGPTGTAEVRTQPTAMAPDPCLVPETAGYRGLDNRAYLIMIHEGDFDPEQASGSDGTAPMFLWSRDAGSVAAAVTAEPDGLQVAVDRLGPGGAEGFVRGGWVEVTNDDRLRERRPGVLAEVDDIVAATLVLVDRPGLAGDLTDVWNPDAHPVVRRWESAGSQTLTTGTWLDLEDGLQIRFGAGTWAPGSWWLVAARTAILPGTQDRHLDWPVDGAGAPLALPPHGFTLHHARLAIAERSGGSWTVEDCRERFAPLTTHISLTARGGDGQEAPGGHWLAAPLGIGVGRGTVPAAGANLSVTVEAGGGLVSPVAPAADGTDPAEAAGAVPVETDADGVARVWWRLGPAASPPPPGDRFHEEADQRVVVELLDAGGDPEHLPLRFHARAVEPYVLVAAGGDGQIGRPGDTLEIALRARVSSVGQAAPDRVVRFTVPSQMLDGAALDEFRGGSLHATTNVVATTPWTGGQRTRVADVATDADGVAQVQWILGTEHGLPVQRVTAVLLDDDGAPTRQATLFSAHLALANEIEWVPPAHLGNLHAGSSVQSALEAWAESTAISMTQTALVRSDGTTQRLTPGAAVPFADLAILDITSAWRPEDEPSNEALLTALVVAADLPVQPGRGEGGRGAAGFTPVHLIGRTTLETRGRGMRLRWELGASRSLLQQGLRDSGGTLVIRVRLLPAALDRRLPSPPPWETAFRVTT